MRTIDGNQLDILVVGDLNQALHYTAGVSPDTRGNTAGRYDQLRYQAEILAFIVTAAGT